MAVALRIRHWRRERGLTLKELAKLVGTSEATLSRLETNRMKVSTDWLMRLARALDVQAADLLEGEDEGGGDRFDVPIGAELHGPTKLAEAPGGTFAFGAEFDDPIACRVLSDAPPFERGDHLVGERCEGEATEALEGRLVFGRGRQGQFVAGRLMRSEGSGWWLAPEGGRGAPEPAPEFEWVAAVQWIIRSADR
jgi:transcriptional regulator with XRE-family HTH domain